MTTTVPRADADADADTGARVVGGGAVVGGNVGGIRQQITDGENGFLVNSTAEAAERIVQLLKNPKLCEQFGARAKEAVRRNYLLSHLVDNWIDLLTDLSQHMSKH